MYHGEHQAGVFNLLLHSYHHSDWFISSQSESNLICPRDHMLAIELIAIDLSKHIIE